MWAPEQWEALLAGGPVGSPDHPQWICSLCRDQLGVTGCGISVVTEAGYRGVVCATDDLAARLEELQLSLGEGPGLEAVRRQRPVLVPDLEQPGLRKDEQWPLFRDGAAAAGARAVFAFPLRVGRVDLGVLALYRDQPGTLPDWGLTGALRAADAAALAVLENHVGQDDEFAADALNRANYQLHVHQATGMVMAQLDVPLDEAFLRLKARAFADDRPLSAVATDVVDRRIRFRREDR